MEPRRDEQEVRTVVLVPERPYPVLMVRCAQVANEASRLRAEAALAERSGCVPQAAAMVQLAEGLERVLYTLAGQVPEPQEGVNPMAKLTKNPEAKIQCMCKVCGTMYAGTAEDSRPEPLAELCARCEALVRGERPSAGAVKRATGNKAPKELIQELRTEWSTVQAKAIAEAHPVTRHVPVKAAAPKVAPEAKAAEKRPQRGAGKPTGTLPPLPQREATYCDSWEDTCATHVPKAMCDEALVALQAAFLVARIEPGLARLQARLSTAKGPEAEVVTRRLAQQAKRYNGNAAKLQRAIEAHPAWQPFLLAAGPALAVGKPLTTLLDKLDGNVLEELRTGSATQATKRAARKAG